jgi:hypothetical protein
VKNFATANYHPVTICTGMVTTAPSTLNGSPINTANGTVFPDASTSTPRHTSSKKKEKRKELACDYILDADKERALTQQIMELYEARDIYWY